MPAVEFWDPTGIWKGEDGLLIGGGPSLRGFPFERLRGRKVIGINDAFRLGPDIVQYNFFGDAGWWIRFRDEATASPIPFVTNAPTLFDWKIPNLLKMDRLLNGIGEGPVLGWNHNSGAAAINLAYTMGCARIFLLGYDLSNRDQRSHWHDHNPNTIVQESFDRFLIGFRTVAEGLKGKVEIYNVTDGSSQLYLFPRIGFETFWEMLDGHHQEDAEATGGMVVETAS